MSELYPDDDGPLGIDVLGDEFENPYQPARRRRYVPMTEQEIERCRQLRINFMRDHFKMTDEEIAEVEAGTPIVRGANLSRETLEAAE